MPELRGTFEPSLAAKVARLQTLADVAAHFRIADVVVQDEFSHDVVAPLDGGRALVFETT